MKIHFNYRPMSVIQPSLGSCGDMGITINVEERDLGLYSPALKQNLESETLHTMQISAEGITLALCSKE